MASFPGTEREWFARLREIAWAEARRLARRGVPLEIEEAADYGIVEGWLAVRHAARQPANLWAFVRVVIRRRLVGQYVQRPARPKRGGLAWHDQLDPTAHALALSVNPWPAIVDALALSQLEAARGGYRQADRVTRQALYERRQRLIAFARKHTRPFD